jgi:hypothetical protein
MLHGTWSDLASFGFVCIDFDNWNIWFKWLEKRIEAIEFASIMFLFADFGMVIAV